MGYLLAGMIFILLNITIRLGWLRIVLLPDVIGYLLLAVKMPEKLKKGSRKFASVQKASIALIFVSIAVGIQRALAKSGTMMVIAYVLNLVMLTAGLAVSYCLTAGFGEIQKNARRNLQVPRLKATWLGMTAVTLIDGLCGWVPVLGNFCHAAAGLITVCYLILFYTTERLHEQLV